MKHTLRPLSFFGLVALMVSIPYSAQAAACYSAPTCYPLSTGEIACVCRPQWIPLIFWGGGFGRILFDPGDANTIYAALDFSALDGRGVFKSTDNGLSWLAISQWQSESRRVSAFAMGPPPSRA